MKKLTAVIVSALILASSVRAADFFVPEPLSGPGPIIPRVAVELAAPALAPVPAFANVASGLASAIPVAAPPSIESASQTLAAHTACGQIENAAAALSRPHAGVANQAEHLNRVFDLSGETSSPDGDISIPAALTAAPVRHEFKSPEGAEQAELDKLAKSLAENGLPLYRIDVVRRAVDNRRPTVVILAPGSRHKVAIAREGGKQSPGDVHLAIDASWLIQEVGPNGKSRLLLKKGVTFDAKGQATIVEYNVPRVVHYFANYFTLGANDRNDGVPFEKNLDVPQSSSLKLEAIVNDKLRMSLLGDASGVEVPAMLTFAMPGHPLAASQQAGSGRVAVIAMPEGPEKAAGIRRRVDEFLDRYEGDEVVVKPSGPQFHSGRGVEFFRKDQRAEIAAHAVELSRNPMMTRDGAVIVSGRVMSAPLERDGRKMETTLRVLAARTPWNGAVTTDVFGRVGPWGKPTTAEAADPRDNAVVEPWENLLKDKNWNLTPAQARDLDRRVRTMGATMLTAIMKSEKDLKRTGEDSYQAQTDMIGLDVMIERHGDTLVPVMIEVNDHDSGGQYNLDRVLAKDRVGTHSREWVATMLQRARRDALRGKTIVIVGAGYPGKRPIFERARELGVKIFLVDKADTWARDFDNVTVIPVENASANAFAQAREKLKTIIRKNGRPDGITTFWEDDVILTAELAKALGLPYHTVSAAKIARSKFRTQAQLERKGIPAARRAVVKNLTSYAADDRDAAIATFIKAAERVGFPAVLKPVSGAAAVGTRRVNSVQEALAAYESISRLVHPGTDSIFTKNSDLLLMRYLDGDEYDVDLLMRDGKAGFASITDNKPTREPSFLATGSRLPSTLTKAQQKKAIAHAIESARAIGLTDGVLHMEGKITSEGPRLIEANARMGGTYVRDWIRRVWGVDLAEEQLMSAAGIPGNPFKSAAPLIHLDGDFLNSNQAGVVTALELPQAAREMLGFEGFREFQHVSDTLSPDGDDVRVAMIEAGGESAKKARSNREAIARHLRFEVAPNDPNLQVPRPREN